MKNFKLIALGTLILVLIGMNNSFAHSSMSNKASSGTDMMKEQQQMMLQKLGPADQNYDLHFINMMIIHHQGAVMMAQDALQKAQHPEIKQMAQNIIDSQTQEIEQMKTWRKQWYNQ